MLSDTRENLKGSDNSLLTGVLLMAVLYFAREVFIPLALAGLLAFLLAPAASRLEHAGLKRTGAALLVVVFALGAVGGMGWVMLGQIYDLAIELPQYQQNVTGKLESLHLNSAGKLTSTVEMLTSIGKRIASNDAAQPAPIISVAPRRRTSGHTATSAPPLTPAEAANKNALPATAQPVQPQPVQVRIEQPEESMLAVAGRTMVPLLHPFATTMIVVIFLIFMLLDRADLQDRLLRLAGSGRMHVTTSAIDDASRRVSRYLQMQFFVNLCYGAAVGICLWAIGVPNPALWALLTFLLRFVPYIGILMAAIGPLLLSIAVTPNWHELIWTVVMFVVLEVVTGNFVEPMLYGASTGISAMAIMIAAIFWTLLWGLPGLLLSTPLTVCLVVIGRQVPKLRYLEVLFGEETALPPSERFYQRMLASNTKEASALIEEKLKSQSPEEVYDSVVIPALTMIEEARQSEEMSGMRAEEVLQAVEELVEEFANTALTEESAIPGRGRHVVCVPARHLADEVGCQLALQVLSPTATVRLVLADDCTAEKLLSSDGRPPDVMCVIAVPPRAIKHLRMRCRQIQARFPDAVIVACLLSKDSDLSNLRSRIPIGDAQHVVCSLQLMKEYVTSLLYSAENPVEAAGDAEDMARKSDDVEEAVHHIEQTDLLDGTEEDIFKRLATDVARAFDAPLALITVADGERRPWEAQCGLPDDTLSTPDCELDRSVCSTMTFTAPSLVIADTDDDELFAEDPFLKNKGIRFYAGAPLKAHDGTLIGSLCVLDTRPRQLTDTQKQMLISMADSVMTAIELYGAPASDDDDTAQTDSIPVPAAILTDAEFVDD